MARENLILIVNRLLNDEQFRTRFFANPEAALAEYQLEGSDIRWLKRITDEKSLVEMSKTLGLAGEIRHIVEATPPALPTTATAAPERIVNTGFADPKTADSPQSPNLPLATNTPYYFWFEVGERIAGSIETEINRLEIDKLPPEARLHVALFGFNDGLQITSGKDVGEIKITPEGRVVVVKRVAEPAVTEDLLNRRLFFPISSPATATTCQMRCNIYYQQTLVQSSLVTVQTTPNPVMGNTPALTSIKDYTLSKSLNGNQLQGMGDTRLSIMLNDNGNGTHGFRFFGENEFKNDATFGEAEIISLIKMARGALQKAAWGDEEEYAPGKNYLYTAGKLDEKQLKKDLVTMAVRGYRFYSTLINRLAGDTDKAWDLADMMMKPGQVQIASKESARLVMPVGMFYDYPLDDSKLSSDYSLCPTFLDAVKGRKNLADIDCFQGNCPSHGKETVICPSGFWGFRHNIGLPVSVKEAPDAPLEIPCPGKPKIAMSVSTDPNFKERPKHERKIQADYSTEYADNRDAALELMKKTQAHLVYFYCHGGFANNIPFLSVGTPDSDWLTTSNIFNKRIRWKGTRPLVFINGCHTTALTPEVALDFVTTFVATSNAAGVVGTEITIFEPIAVAFAEECFRLFLTERKTLGESVRLARLKMLQDGNPLGLVYVPYVLPGLKLA